MKEKNVLVDKEGRKHDYLRISLTERCNLRCTYCMPVDGVELSPKESIMSADEIIAIAKIFVAHGVKKIRLTGGEPLIRKNVSRILTDLSDLDVEIAITTNGVIVDRYMDDFKRLGINNINISLDTLDRNKYQLITRRDDYNKVMENIRLMEDNGFKTKLNIVLMKGFNDNEIIDFIRLTKDRNVSIRFIEFMPFDGNSWNMDKLVSQKTILDMLGKEFEEENIIRQNDKPNDTARNYKIKDFAGSFAIISTVTNPFCDTCNRIRLTANGKLKNCLFSQSETDLLTSYRAGGDITPLIQASLGQKHKTRGGLTEDIDFTDPEKHSNRSMIMIGG